MSVNEPAASQLSLVGGRFCLDFTNTVDWHVGPHPQEYLTSYADLVAWSQHAHLVDESHAQQLLADPGRPLSGVSRLPGCSASRISQLMRDSTSMALSSHDSHERAVSKRGS